MFLNLDKFKSINDLHGHAAGDAALLTLANRIIEAVQAPCDVNCVELMVNSSAGIAIFPGDGVTAEALIQSADAAMYQAKQSKSGYTYASNNEPTECFR